MKKEYIGDNVHVEVYGNDIILLTVQDEDGVESDVIHLQPHVLKELLAYIEEWQKEPVS